jgi:hypothetical protein
MTVTIMHDVRNYLLTDLGKKSKATAKMSRGEARVTFAYKIRRSWQNGRFHLKREASSSLFVL